MKKRTYLKIGTRIMLLLSMAVLSLLLIVPQASADTPTPAPTQAAPTITPVPPNQSPGQTTTPVPPSQPAPTSGLSIKTLSVQVWPEYDDPRILVTYQGDFGQSDSFAKPVPLNWTIPQTADIKQACALQPPDNTHLCQLYQVTNNGQTLSYNLPIPTFYFEYYYPGVAGQGQGDKSFSFDFKADYPIEKLNIDVEQPLRSSSFTMSPTSASVLSDQSGFKHYTLSYDNVAAGQVIPIKSSYIKNDAKPSISGSGGSGGGSSFPVVAVVIPVLILVAGGVWFTMFRKKGNTYQRESARSSGRQNAPRQSDTMNRSGARPNVSRQQVEPRAGVKPNVPRQPVGPKPAGKKSAFCSNCGAPLDPEDKFCHECGTKSKGYQD